MKLKVMAAAVTLSFVSQVGIAAEPSRETDRSAAAGFIVGAVTGGPAGAFAGAVLGGEVVGRWFRTRRENRELTIELAELRTVLNEERSHNDALVSALNQDLDKMVNLQAVASRTTNLPIQFRTSSSDIEAQYREDLDKIVQLLKRNRDASVTLSGFADRRGDDTFNQSLSEDRVTSVREYLMSRGVSENQVITVAFGESKPLSNQETLEGNFFDRRVILELNMNIDPQLATR